ncbi:MAG TPA: RecQ family ATP-dependent DNA helicase [Acidimicrobiia bacterium]
MPEPLDDAARELLGRLTGQPEAEFRPGQLEAIRAVVGERRRALVVQRTGWGKSAVYFIATRLLRDRGAGATLLVSPLLALMRNQLEMAARAGVHAATINSANRDDWETVEKDVRDGRVDLLLVSPERLNNPRFRADVLPHLAAEVGMLVVDEAHCISDWGHDFRPDYRRVAQVIDSLPAGVPVLGTTATANARVVADVAAQLGHHGDASQDGAGAGGGDLAVFRGPLGRESLSLAVVHLPDPAARLAWLAREVPGLPGSGIIYCLTVADTERVTGWLVRQGLDAVAYSGGVDDTERLRIEDLLATNRVKAVVATSALGMGYDKPDLGFVVHYQTPGSPIAYYQQVGRAGRALADSHGILLVGTEDTDIQDYFIRVAFPSRPLAESVVGLLEAQAGGPVKVDELLREVNIGKARLEAMLKILDVDGAVERVSASVYARTDQPWVYDEERVERVTAARRAEQAAMADYVTTTGCLMAFLRRQLDDPDPAPCGRCANCTGRQWAIDLEPAAVVTAGTYLRSATLAIEARKQWMGAVPGLPFTIPADLRVEEGRSLSIYGDGGWGSVVRGRRQAGKAYPDELVDAAIRRVRAWAPQPAPTWVTCVPSARAPEQVAGLARRLAGALGLPFVEAVARTWPAPPQEEMANSAQQLRNVHGAFAVAGDVLPGPVLLVDDIHDSRWTLTVVGATLRRAGAGPVHPFTLAQATSD